MREKSRWIGIFLCIFCVCAVLGGCAQIRSLFLTEDGQEVVTTAVSHRIYWINREETRIIEVAKEFASTEVEDLINECLADLSEAPDDNVYRSVLYGNVHVNNFTYDADSKQVTLYFDESYNEQSREAEILTRAAIVKTLTQFNDDIQYVSFVIGETPLTGDDGNTLLMRNKDFVLDINGNMEYVREDYVTLYFANDDRSALKVEDVVVKYLSKINLETAVVNSLISGPIHDDLHSAIPEDTRVNKVSVKEGICYVDLSKEFLQRVDDQSFALNVYSIVNSLTQLSGISRVQFMIDGEIFTESIDGVKIDGLIEKDMSFVEKQTKASDVEEDNPLDLEKEIRERGIGAPETEVQTEPAQSAVEESETAQAGSVEETPAVAQE